MSESASATTGRLQIVVSDDRLRAYLETADPASPGFEPPTDEQILAALEAERVAVTDEVTARIAEYRALASKVVPVEGEGEDGPAEIPPRFLIAEGRAPVDAVDGGVEWSEQFEQHARDWQGDSQVNYYTLNSIMTVEEGVTIGTMTPPQKGQEGLDVYGSALSPRRKEGQELKLGAGVEPVKEGSSELVTKTAGRVVLEHGKLSVDDVLIIPGDVDFSSGNVDACVEVHVRGTVMSQFVIKTTKSLVVEKAIEAADVQVAGDVQVRGGILGHDRSGTVRADGSITVHFCDGADVVAGADVQIGKESLNSRIHAHGRVRMEHGSLIAGECYARQGVEVRTLGSDAGIGTRVAVGIHESILYRNRKATAEIKIYRKRAELIREKVQPLLANIKRLTAGQREQATELMCKADEIESEADTLQTETDEQLEKARPPEPAYILLGNHAHPGVEIVFGLRQTWIKKPLRGPVRIELREVRGATEIVAVSNVSGSVMVLPCAMIPDEELERCYGEEEPENDDEPDGDDKKA